MTHLHWSVSVVHLSQSMSLHTSRALAGNKDTLECYKSSLEGGNGHCSVFSHCIAPLHWSVGIMHWKEMMALHNIRTLECTHNCIAS